MGFILFAFLLAIVGQFLWFRFHRIGKKQFIKYDKEHSNIAVLNAEEVVSKLSKSSVLGISNIECQPDQVHFICKKNSYTINIENGKAYVEYDMSGCEVRFSKIGRLIRQFRFWKSAHEAMLINTIMDTLQNDKLSDQKEYKEIQMYSKAIVVSVVSALLFSVIGLSTFIGSEHNKAISEAQKMEFCDGVTYEELIDAYLKETKWVVFNSDNDTAIVEVNGTSIDGKEVCIQFSGDLGMGLSYKKLKLRYFEVDAVSLDPDYMMEYIYVSYYLNE